MAIIDFLRALFANPTVSRTPRGASISFDDIFLDFLWQITLRVQTSAFSSSSPGTTYRRLGTGTERPGTDIRRLKSGTRKPETGTRMSGANTRRPGKVLGGEGMVY